MAKGTTIRMWRRTIFVLLVLIIIGFGAIIFSLVRLQLVQGEELHTRAVDNQMQDTSISAQRGTIYDCNMESSLRRYGAASAIKRVTRAGVPSGSLLRSIGDMRRFLERQRE